MTVRLGSEHRRVRDGDARERAGAPRDERRLRRHHRRATERLDDPRRHRARPPAASTSSSRRRRWSGLARARATSSDYPHVCGEQKASAALALVLAADLGNAFSMGRIAPADYRKRARGALERSAALSVQRLRVRLLARLRLSATCISRATCFTSCTWRTSSASLPIADVVATALDFLEQKLKQPAPKQVQWLPAWSATVGVRREGPDRARPQSGLEHHPAVRDARPAPGVRL